MLRGSVRIQEIAADIHDRLPPPAHGETLLRLHLRHRAGLQVFRLRQGKERFYILRRDDHRHPLLALRDRQLRSIQAFILLRHLIQIDIQPVRQLADGHADTARAKVVAALDHPAGIPIPEQALQLPLLGGVALLNLRTAGLHAVGVVRLGRARCATNTIPTGAATQKNHHISRLRPFPAHILRRRRRNHRADLHPLGRIARMINFVDDARCQTDLISVG